MRNVPSEIAECAHGQNIGMCGENVTPMPLAVSLRLSPWQSRFAWGPGASSSQGTGRATLPLRSVLGVCLHVLGCSAVLPTFITNLMSPDHKLLRQGPVRAARRCILPTRPRLRGAVALEIRVECNRK